MTRAGLYVYSAAILALLTASGIGAFETGTWAMEVAPVFIVLPLMMATHRRFPLTPLLYGLIALHMVVLMLGGHYTYARVPLGFWMEDVFGFTRNHYDRIGHLMQGFVPAIAAREILLRRTTLAAPGMRGGWLFLVVTSICLAFSAIYELSSGAWPKPWARPRKISWARRAIRSTPRRTCSAPGSARWQRSGCWRAGTSGNWQGCRPLAETEAATPARPRSSRRVRGRLQ